MAKEYIEREAVMAELKEELEYNTLMYTEEQNRLVNTGLKIALKDVKRFPAADVVEVVRCKDCAKRCTARCVFGDEYDNDVCEDDDFCSYGERRADNG